MTSIIALKGKISSKNFKCICLKKQKTSYQFLFHFWNLHQIFNILGKNVRRIAQIFLKYWLQKTLILQCLKDFVSGRPLAVDILTSPKYYWNLTDSTFAQMVYFLGKFTTEFEFFLFMARILASGSQWVQKQSYDFRCYQERCFPTQYLPKWQIIWIKVLSGRFQQCLVPLNLLTGKGCPKTGPFRYSKSQLFLSQ